MYFRRATVLSLAILAGCAHSPAAKTFYATEAVMKPVYHAQPPLTAQEFEKYGVVGMTHTSTAYAIGSMPYIIAYGGMLVRSKTAKEF
jgi:hypothetical protein